MLDTPISRFVYSKEDLDNKERFYKTLDKYHWLVKTKQYHHMLMSEMIQPKTEWMINTAVFGGNKTFRDKLKFSTRLLTNQHVIDEIKDMDNRYFYNNEIIYSRDLKIPHPKLHLRNFILKPLLDNKFKWFRNI